MDFWAMAAAKWSSLPAEVPDQIASCTTEEVLDSATALRYPWATSCSLYGSILTPAARRNSSSGFWTIRILSIVGTKKHNLRSIKSLLRKSSSQQTNRVDKKRQKIVTNGSNCTSKPFDRPVPAVAKKCSSQGELLNYTYDYLNSAIFVRRKTDVRYLTEIKRALRDKLREIIESKAKTYAKDSPRNINKSPTTCLCDAKRYKVQFLNALKDWVKCIPVYSDFSEEDKKTQDRILNELTNNLRELDVTDFNLRAKTEILQSLDLLPMWHPTDSHEATVLKQHLADQLIERLLILDKKSTNAKEIFENKHDKGIEFDSGKIKSEDIKIMPHKYASRLKKRADKCSTDEKQYMKPLKSGQFDFLNEPPHKYENSKDAVESKITGTSPLQLHNTEVPIAKQITVKFKDGDREAQKKVKLFDFNPPEIIKMDDDPEDTEEIRNYTNDKDALALKNEKALDQTEDVPKLSHPHPYYQKNKMSAYDSEHIEENEIQGKEQRKCKALLNKDDICSDLQNRPKFTKYFTQQTPSHQSTTDDENTYDDTTTLSYLYTKDQKESAKFLNNKNNENDSDIEDNGSITSDINSLDLIKGDRRNVWKWSKDKPEFSRLSIPEKKEFAYIPKTKISEHDYENMEVSKLQQNKHREKNKWLDKEAADRRIHSRTKNKFVKKIKQELPSDESISHHEPFLQKNIGQQKDLPRNKEIPEFANLYSTEEMKNSTKNKITKNCLDIEDTQVQPKRHEKKSEWVNKEAVNGPEDTQHKTRNVKNLEQESHLDESKTNDQSILGLINNWFQSIPELAGENQLKHKKDLQDLASQLYEIQTSGEDFENIQDDILEAITDWLQYMLTKNNKRLSSATFNNLVSELVKGFNDIPKQNIYMQNERDMYDDVITMLKDILGLDSNIDLDEYNTIEDLVSTLNDIRNSDEELVETLTRDAINNFIKTLSADTGVDLIPKDRELFKQTLFRRSKQEPQHRKHWHKQIHFGSSTPKASKRNSLSPNLSPIRNVSLEKEQTELDEYLNTLNKVIESWVNGLELSIGIVELRNLIGNIISDIVDRQKYLQVSNIKKSESNELEHLKYLIFRRLNKLNVEDLPKIILRVGDLNKRISSVRTPELIKLFNTSDLTTRTAYLVNSLKTWLANIPQDLAGSPEEPFSEEVFLDLANKLTDLEYTINYYYIKNAICLWLPTIFGNIDKNTLNNLADSLIKHLINNLTVQNRSNVGSMYRLSLWDTISNTLPSINLTAGDDLHAFDLRKERLVDAFINLHYFAGDMVELEKFKSKLLDEVNKFCNEYLQRYPESPINPEELSKKLYSALCKVSLTDIETVRSELEQVRLKEEIMDWLQTVPLDKSKITESQLNAKVSDLAKRLHGLEKDKYIDPNNYNEMKFGILTWLQTLDVKDGGQITTLADVLIDKLKTTDKSRMLSISNIGKHGDNIIPQYLQSNLNVEDRAYLDRIRKRSDYNLGVMKTDLCKDVCASAPLRECAMQTEIRSSETFHTPQSLNGRCNNREVSPQVIIKEYYWDSTSNNVNQRSSGSCRPLSTSPPCNRISETAPQLKRKHQLPKNSNAQTDQVFNNAFPKSLQAEKICDNINDRLGCLADTGHSSKLPTSCYIPGKLRTSTSQRINLPSEIIGCRRRGDNCSNRQQTYTKCGERNFNYRSHCNSHVPESSSKYCPNCVRSCPYPSNLFFK
ncbi:jg17634 [Pararge aegeria aegeria]|uniref:Jg17634 protein n=1 Tax=Pararge aegeria aegeria TaxID=348720 RepID=A0A8S4R164_9NEOP|nr:jg17634 [Pararge aegeria aegeria]